jgi:Hypothetical glycosyl hydrolase family 15
MSELRYTVPKQMGEHIKVFFPNIGLTTVREPTQTEMDYAWAFFNLMRKGDWQMFSRITKVGDEFIPRRYPEMDVEVGAPIEDATQISPNVWRREFTQAIAYVNISDAPATVTLPTAGAPLHTALGATVNSSLTLESFKGLTIYKTP